ncbi:hypothetical protein ACQZ6F_29890 [Rhizobium sp. A22-96]
MAVGDGGIVVVKGDLTIPSRDWPGVSPILFDLANDPDELVDLGRDPGKADIIHALQLAFERRLAMK